MIPEPLRASPRTPLGDSVLVCSSFVPWFAWPRLFHRNATAYRNRSVVVSAEASTGCNGIGQAAVALLARPLDSGTTANIWCIVSLARTAWFGLERFQNHCEQVPQFRWATVSLVPVSSHGLLCLSVFRGNAAAYRNWLVVASAEASTCWNGIER